MTLRHGDARAWSTPIREEIERLESELSTWRPGSRVSDWNASTTTLPLEISEELCDLVERAIEIGEASGGSLDITVGPLVDAWGAGPSGPRESPPDADTITTLLSRVGISRLVLDREQRTLKKTHPEVQIDLGAFLQGYAADRIAERLDEAKVGDFLIEVGGELRARGAWKVAIEDPWNPGKSLRTLTLEDASLATSGSYRNDRHIISPVTGRPVTTPWILCAVKHPLCRDADAWATALVASPDAAEQARSAGITVLLVGRSGAEHRVGDF